MVACAKFLGREVETCTRGEVCVCAKEELKCTCSDGPFHYESCPLYDKNRKNPFAELGKAMTVPNAAMSGAERPLDGTVMRKE